MEVGGKKKEELRIGWNVGRSWKNRVGNVLGRNKDGLSSLPSTKVVLARTAGVSYIGRGDHVSLALGLACPRGGSLSGECIRVLTVSFAKTSFIPKRYRQRLHRLD